jgi:hypothetical protein
MVCKLDRPDPQTLFDRIKNNFSANVLGGLQVVPESNEWYVVANDYAMHEQFYSIAEAQWKAQDPRYMCCDDLYDYAAQRGFTPRPAMSSQGYVRVSGVSGTIVPTPLEVTIESQNFRATGTIPGQVPPEGYFDVRVRAVVPGVDGNIAITSSTGTLATAVSGLDNTVEVRGTSFCGGADAEECEPFRARFLKAQAYHPRANAEWIMEKLKEWPCVTRVCERGGSCCVVPSEGTDCGCNTCSQQLGFYVMFDNTFDCGIPPDCVVTDLNTWMWGDPPGKGLGQADYGMCGTIYAPVASVVDVTVTGMACATAAEQKTVRERIADLFLTACPSQLFPIRQVELVIAQVVGTSEPFEVTMADRTGNMTFTPCGDLDPNCDILPCLGEINFVGLPLQAGVC